MSEAELNLFVALLIAANREDDQPIFFALVVSLITFPCYRMVLFEVLPKNSER